MLANIGLEPVRVWMHVHTHAYLCIPIIVSTITAISS